MTIFYIGKNKNTVKGLASYKDNSNMEVRATKVFPWN